MVDVTLKVLKITTADLQNLQANRSSTSTYDQPSMDPQQHANVYYDGVVMFGGEPVVAV